MITRTICQKVFALSAIVVTNFTLLNAQVLTKTFVFNFYAEDFRVEQITSERECEIFPKFDYSFGELGEPSLPHLSYKILLPDNYDIDNFTYSVGTDTCRFNRVFFYPTADDFIDDNPDTLTVDSILLCPTPMPVSGPGPHPEIPSYPLKTFPAKVQYVGGNGWDGYQLEVFEICPFTYYAIDQKLVLSTDFELTISITPNNQEPPFHRGDADELVKSEIHNPEDFGKGAENWMANSIGKNPIPPYSKVYCPSSIIFCSSTTATKLEIYTMDAVKVGEAAFTNGEATVKVGKTPATYLYIVTYPNGRRESGKVVIGK